MPVNGRLKDVPSGHIMILPRQWFWWSVAVGQLFLDYPWMSQELPVVWYCNVLPSKQNARECNIRKSPIQSFIKFYILTRHGLRRFHVNGEEFFSVHSHQTIWKSVCYRHDILWRRRENQIKTGKNHWECYLQVYSPSSTLKRMVERCIVSWSSVVVF